MTQANRDRSTAAAYPLPPATKNATPAIAARFAEWRDAATRADDPGITDAESAAHTEVAQRAASRLARTPGRKPEDTALKLHVFACESIPDSSVFVTERLLRSMIADHDRLTNPGSI